MEIVSKTSEFHVVFQSRGLALNGNYVGVNVVMEFFSSFTRFLIENYFFVAPRNIFK